MPTTDNVHYLVFHGPATTRATRDYSTYSTHVGLVKSRWRDTSHRGGPRVGDRLVQGPHSRHLCSHANAQLPTSGTPSPHFTVTQQAD